MDWRKFLVGSGLAVSLGSILVGINEGVKSCNHYDFQTSRVTVHSRPTGYLPYSKVEYTLIGADHSEEVLACDTSFQVHCVLYQNLDGNETVDRIRKSHFVANSIEKVDDILIRTQDYGSNKADFDRGDELLLSERTKSKK